MVTAKAKTKSKVGSKVAKVATAKVAKGKVASKAVPKAPKKVAPKPAPKAAKKTVPKPAPKAAKKTAVKAPVGAHKMPADRHVAVALPPASKSLPKPSNVKVGGGMSEAEVVKQARTDYMSKQQLAFFKQRLLDLQSELRENAGATTEHLRELSVAPDPADRATLEEEHALELRTRDRERKLLKKVQSALMRIEDGSYGYCEETGEPIGIQRLMARPTATLTIEAQERRELKQKMYGE